MRRLTIALAFLALSGTTRAAEVTVQVLTDAGKPVADAVVAITPAGGLSPTKVKPTAPLAVAQRDLQFDPFVLVVPVGETVAFPNFDGVQHHVYSFSLAKKFEIQLYGRDEARSVSFPVPGVVAIGCNIHDRMSAFIYVTQTPHTAKTGADGKITIANVPEGQATATIWHPHAASPGERIEQSLSVTPVTSLAVQLNLRTQRRPRHGNY